MEEFKCLTCSKLFQSRKKDKKRIPKYCSRKCFQIREKKPETLKKMSDAKLGKKPWNKGVKMWEHKEHPRGTLGKSIRKGYKVSEETKKRLSDSHLGKKYPQITGKSHWNWKGGITTENERVRKSAEYNAWRRQVFEKDDYTCQQCQTRGGNLHADHILPFSLYIDKRFDISNGRTLCIECHRKTDTYGVKVLRHRRKQMGEVPQEERKRRYSQAQRKGDRMEHGSMKISELTIDPKKQKSEITFLVQSDPDSWVMKINDEGIHFNRERYPDTDPAGFANAVMEILENHVDVKFTKK